MTNLKMQAFAFAQNLFLMLIRAHLIIIISFFQMIVLWIDITRDQVFFINIIIEFNYIFKHNPNFTVMLHLIRFLVYCKFKFSWYRHHNLKLIITMIVKFSNNLVSIRLFNCLNYWALISAYNYVICIHHSIIWWLLIHFLISVFHSDALIYFHLTITSLLKF